MALNAGAVPRRSRRRSEQVERSEEQLLLDYHRTRDRRLREQIVARYGWLARAVAGQMKRPGEDLDDLVQVASIGVLKAIERFDPELGSFRAYASTTARGEIKRHYRDHAWSVSVPRRLKDLRSTVAAATEVLQERLRRSPTPDELAEYLRLPRDDIDACISAGANFRALPLSGPDGGERLAAALVAPDWEHGLVNRLHANATVRALVERLPARLQTVVRLRYVDQLTQAEIGATIGVSQVHVGRLLLRALDLLRLDAGQSGEPSGWLEDRSA